MTQQFEQHPPVQQHKEYSDEIDLGQLLRVLLRHKWQIIFFTITVGMFATIYAYSLTPMYSASTTVLLESEKAKVQSLDDIYNQKSSDYEYYYTQLEIITSSPIAKKVVDIIGLDQFEMFHITAQEYIEYYPSAAGFSAEKINNLIKAEQRIIAENYVLSGLSAEPIKDTYIVVISFTSQYPDLAAFIANTAAQAYIENKMEVNIEQINKSATWLNQSLAGLKQRLDDSEDKLQAFQEKESLVDIGGIKSLSAKEVEKLSAELLMAKQDLKQIELIKNVVSSNKNEHQKLASLPVVINHVAVKNATAQQRAAQEHVAELSLTYGPKHPKLIAAKADLNREQANVKKIINELVDDVEHEYVNIQNRVHQTENSLQQAKLKYQQLSRTENLRRELKQEVETNKELYDAFFVRLKETAELQSFETSAGRVIEQAFAPSSPIKPKKKLIIVLAMLLAGMASVALVLLLEAFNSTIRSVDDIENKLHMQLLGIVPKVKGAPQSMVNQAIEKFSKSTDETSKLNIREFFDSEGKGFAEAIRTLRTSLLLSSAEDVNKVYSVTSTLPGEGKTTVSTNLAFAFGQLGKTLLIDTDMRRPSVANNFKFEQQKPGLSNLITCQNTLQECLIHDEFSGIDIISAGDLPPNPQELLASNKFKELINTLKQTYDRIVIDTPPVQAVSDAMVVARLADAILYVVKAEDTKEKHIKNGLKRLSLGGITVNGVVFNQIDLDKARQYEDFTGYYDQYGYS